MCVSDYSRRRPGDIHRVHVVDVALYFESVRSLTVAPRQSSGQPYAMHKQVLILAVHRCAAEAVTRRRRRRWRWHPIRARSRPSRSTRSPGPGRIRSPEDGGSPIISLSLVLSHIITYKNLLQYT